MLSAMSFFYGFLFVGFFCGFLHNHNPYCGRFLFSCAFCYELLLWVSFVSFFMIIISMVGSSLWSARGVLCFLYLHNFHGRIPFFPYDHNLRGPIVVRPGKVVSLAPDGNQQNLLITTPPDGQKENQKRKRKKEDKKHSPR